MVRTNMQIGIRERQPLIARYWKMPMKSKVLQWYLVITKSIALLPVSAMHVDESGIWWKELKQKKNANWFVAKPGIVLQED